VSAAPSAVDLAGASIHRHLEAGIRDWTVGQLVRWTLRSNRCTRADLAKAAGVSVYQIDQLRRIYPPGSTG